MVLHFYFNRDKFGYWRNATIKCDGEIKTINGGSIITECIYRESAKEGHQNHGGM